jgi:uncharacterized repeat protein (TIGR03843 family)
VRVVPLPDRTRSSGSARLGGAPGTPAAEVSEERALAFLAHGTIDVLGRIPWASNATLLVDVCHEDLDGLAIYKPRRGERPLWDFPGGTLWRREVAAYHVSELLGWALVPPTVGRRDGPYGAGSLQLYVEADPQVTAFDLLDAQEPALRRVAAFDVVVNNADRKAGHTLRADDGRVWAIDHGVCFHVEPKLRTVLWEFAGERLDAAVLEALGRLAEELGLRERLGALRGLLAGEEIAALAARAERLARTGRLPHPGPGRPYPWPLV